MPETLPVRTPGMDWLMARMIPFRFDNLTGVFIARGSCTALWERWRSRLR